MMEEYRYYGEPGKGVDIYDRYILKSRFLGQTYKSRLIRQIDLYAGIYGTKRKFTSLCFERLNRTSFFRFKIATNYILNFQFLRGLETNC